jgi:hypothetical protein
MLRDDERALIRERSFTNAGLREPFYGFREAVELLVERQVPTAQNHFRLVAVRRASGHRERDYLHSYFGNPEHSPDRHL